VIEVQAIQSSRAGRFVIGHRSRPKPSAAVAFPTVHAILWSVRLGDREGLCPSGLSIDGLKPVSDCCDQVPRLRRCDCTDISAEVDLLDVAGFWIEPLDKMTFDVNPGQPLLVLQPDGPFADHVVRVGDQLDRY
jgi:hypothetical protein